jgi:hypothetical protein
MSRRGSLSWRGACGLLSWCGSWRGVVAVLVRILARSRFAVIIDVPARFAVLVWCVWFAVLAWCGAVRCPGAARVVCCPGVDPGVVLFDALVWSQFGYDLILKGIIDLIGLCWVLL